MTYRSVSISVPRVIQANCMCRAFSHDTRVHAQYRTGCLEKLRSRPPVMCRHEWQPSVYAHSRITLAVMISEPSPIPNDPFGPRYAWIMSYVFSTETSTVKPKK